MTPLIRSSNVGPTAATGGGGSTTAVVGVGAAGSGLGDAGDVITGLDALAVVAGAWAAGVVSFAGGATEGVGSDAAADAEDVDAEDVDAANDDGDAPGNVACTVAQELMARTRPTAAATDGRKRRNGPICRFAFRRRFEGQWQRRKQGRRGENRGGLRWRDSRYRPEGSFILTWLSRGLNGAHVTLAPRGTKENVPLAAQERNESVPLDTPLFRHQLRPGIRKAMVHRFLVRLNPDGLVSGSRLTS